MGVETELFPLPSEKRENTTMHIVKKHQPPFLTSSSPYNQSEESNKIVGLAFAFVDILF